MTKWIDDCQLPENLAKKSRKYIFRNEHRYLISFFETLNFKRFFTFAYISLMKPN